MYFQLPVSREAFCGTESASSMEGSTNQLAKIISSCFDLRNIDTEIKSFIHSFIHSFVRSFVRSFVHSFNILLSSNQTDVT